MILLEIHKEVSKVRPISKRQVLRYMKRFKIEAVGIRQKPQRYPDDAAVIICDKLGAPPTLTMRQLRDLRRRSEKARARLTNARQPKLRNGNGRK